MTPDDKDALTFAIGILLVGTLCFAAGIFAVVSLFK
jgi:hypothetical protein